MVAERPRVPPTATRFDVPAASWCQDVRCPLCLPRPVRVLRQRPRVQRPPVRRPASGACPASACPVSARPVSDTPVSVSGVQSPVSDVGCPVSGIRACRVCVRLSAPVSSWSTRVRRAVTRLGQARSASHPHRIRDRLVGCPSRSLVLGVGRAGSGGIGWTRPPS